MLALTSGQTLDRVPQRSVTSQAHLRARTPSSCPPTPSNMRRRRVLKVRSHLGARREIDPQLANRIARGCCQLVQPHLPKGQAKPIHLRERVYRSRWSCWSVACRRRRWRCLLRRSTVLRDELLCVHFVHKSYQIPDYTAYDQMLGAFKRLVPVPTA